MKNEPHVIGDRVPNQHALIAELKLVPQSTAGKEAASAAQPGPRIHFRRLIAIVELIGRTVRQRRNRLALLELNDEQLKDIGVSRCQAYGDQYSRYRRCDVNDVGADV
jgi:uncharacterized protein YjiS (DUF1127 family)